ncbi:hypothetical protein CC2G_013582 [Coprinopsis cinerea AmutBmut pab1-1]|nr:hypothetical protein CC2G_013582 [Coprinopsis cinerea AmutBmut pab1-1]
MTTNGQPDQCQTGEASFVTVRDATERYVVVVVMGPPGAGKSTLINSLLGANNRSQYLEVGRSLEPCTKTLKAVTIRPSPVYRPEGLWSINRRRSCDYKTPVERSVPKLKIQKELVDQNRTLPQTGAGRQLKSILKNAAKRENNNPVLRQALAQFRTPFSVRWKQFLGIYRFNEDKAFGKETVVWSSPSPNA